MKKERERREGWDKKREGPGTCLIVYRRSFIFSPSHGRAWDSSPLCPRISPPSGELSSASARLFHSQDEQCNHATSSLIMSAGPGSGASNCAEEPQRLIEATAGAWLFIQCSRAYNPPYSPNSHPARCSTISGGCAAAAGREAAFPKMAFSLMKSSTNLYEVAATCVAAAAVKM